MLIEVAKVTCDQFLSFTITTPEKMAIWLSGYYHGKHGDTMIDTEVFEANLNKVEQYCIRNPKIPIITAVETVLKPDKR